MLSAVNGEILGSPPLTRERQMKAILPDCPLRITPAHAGKTKRTAQSCKDNWDHPRSRGKDHVSKRSNETDSGSPPLTRERLLITLYIHQYFGITPAHAGKTIFCLIGVSGVKDHPRSRGKDLEKDYDNAGLLGSPPLTRERPKQQQDRIRDIRITPAHAGKTHQKI